MNLRETFVREFSFITGNYRIIIISWMLMDLAMEMPAPYFQYYVQALGGSPVSLGVIGLAGFFAMAAVAFPGGYLADKHGRRWLVTTMTFAMASSYTFFALAPTWHFILFGRIFNSLCLIYQPALFAIVQDSLPPNKRGMGSSIAQLIHGTFNTPGPVIAGFLFIRFGLILGMRIIYVIMIVLYLTAAVYRLRLKETLPSAEPIRFRYFISSYPDAVRDSFGVWRVVPRSMFYLFISRSLIMFGLSVSQVINALYARDVLGIPEERWFLVFIPLLLTMIVASIPIGKFVDKHGRKVPLVSGLFVFGVATYIFMNGTFVTVMVAMVLFGIAQLLAMTASMALTADLVVPENRGKVSGFMNFMGYIVMGVGMLLGGYLYGTFSIPRLPFYAALILATVAALVVLFFVQEPKEVVGPVQEIDTP